MTLSGFAVGVGLSIFFAFKGVYTVISHIHWALTTEHEVAHFFLGKIVHDPGWLFYPFMLSIKSAPLTLPLALFGLLFTLRNRQKEEYARQYRLAIVFLLFVVLFTFFLSVAAKKFSRYLVPAFPILDILAAIGAYTLIKWGFSFIGINNRIKRWGQFAMVLLVVIVQIVPVFYLHPYYGTYYNPFWKVTDITKVCTIGDASGLDIAAEYLNKKPNAKNLTVRVSPLSAEFFGYYFVGNSYRSDQQNSYLEPDYEVVYIRDLQIGRVKKEDTPGILERVISMNGIDYVWIYRL